MILLQMEMQVSIGSVISRSPRGITLLLGLLLLDTGQRLAPGLVTGLLLANPTDAFRVFNLTLIEGVRDVGGLSGLGPSSIQAKDDRRFVEERSLGRVDVLRGSSRIVCRRRLHLSRRECDHVSLVAPNRNHEATAKAILDDRSGADYYADPKILAQFLGSALGRA